MTLWDQFTDEQREAMVQELVGALPDSGIPHNFRDGLVRYFSDGILPGGFLQAVLCNDLAQAVCRADPWSLWALAALVGYLNMHAPALAWGSRAKVLAWTTTPGRLEISGGPDAATDLIAANEADAKQALTLFRSMRVEELTRLRVAHDMDQRENCMAGRLAGVVFSAGRMALIDLVLREKGEV